MKLARIDDGRLLGGVCVGLSRRYRLDVTLVRFAFLAASLASGLGILLYVALWLGLPRAGTMEPRSSARDLAVSRVEQVGAELGAMGRGLGRGLPRVELRSLGTNRSRAALVTMGAGALVLLASFGLFDWITPIRAVGLAALVLGAAALLELHRPETRR